MKGCPLKCQWCQNPESWRFYPEIMTRDAKCILCGKCVEVCSGGAIIVDQKEGREIDRAKCNFCFKCVTACPTGAITKVGEYMTVAEIISEIDKNELFYYRSGGGVTISGGEPLFQGLFTYNLLRGCKERGFHTTLDTCGYSRWYILERMLRYVDLILYDIKHMNPNRHKEATGVDNALILHNLRKIPADKKIWLRIPLIPGFNDSKENLREVGELAREIRAEKVSILPFHNLGEGKFRGIREQHVIEKIGPPDKAHVENLQAFMQGLGIEVTVGN